jgi:hypothetical protein
VLLSRFWYVALAVVIGVGLSLLYLSTSVSNRAARKTADSLLTATSKSVSWYLTSDARERAAALIKVAVDEDVRKALGAAAKADTIKDVGSDLREKAKSALKRFREGEASKGGKVFDALWVVDIQGRPIAADNYEKGTSEYFELGGYPVVADALAGWIRDDSWVWDGQIMRVVAHPVQDVAGGPPIGAIIGGKWVNEQYAADIADKTGGSVAFYAGGTRVASAAPPGDDMHKSALEVNAVDLEALEKDENYTEKGRTAPHVLREQPGFDVSAVFARMPGEAWELGAGYVVGHRQATVSDPFEYQTLASDDDKKAVPLTLVILVAVAAALVGLAFSVLEHTMPLGRFRRAVGELAAQKSGNEMLKPSTFRGTYRKIAQLVNDSLDKVAASSGIERGPADLEKVLGPLPAQPQMSAFSVPGPAASRPGVTPDSQADKPRTLPEAGLVPDSGARALPKPPRKSMPRAPGVAPESDGPGSMPGGSLPGAAVAAPARGFPQAPRPIAADDDEGPTLMQPVGRVLAAATAAAGAVSSSGPPDDDDGAPLLDEETEWRQVYAQFLSMKKQLGEPVEKLTYDKFRGTLQRNKEALMARHGCTRVRFRVYEKQGRAALKASPVK